MAALAATAALFAEAALAQSCVPNNPTSRVLANFIGGADGAPQSSGVVFREGSPIPPATGWTESVVYDFTGQPSDGANPISGLTFVARRVANSG